MSAAEKKTVFRIAIVLGTMRQRITATVQNKAIFSGKFK